MHPILLHYRLPSEFLATWGETGKMVGYLYYWIAGAVICLALAWWGLSPDASKGRRAAGWLGLLGVLGFGLILAGIGVGRLRFIQLHTYGVLVAVGFLIGIVLAVRESEKTGEDSEQILDLAFWLLIAAMVGARLGYVLTHWKIYIADIKQGVVWYQWKIFRLWEGGLSFMGGFILSLIVALIFVKIYELNFWKLADIVIPSVAIGQFFGYLGNLAAGFGYGKMTDLPWAVTFSAGPAPREIPLHPTQLYQALAVLFIYFAVIWIRSNKRYHGQAFLWYLVLFSTFSFVVEFFRGDACTAGVLEEGVCRAMIVSKDVIKQLGGVELLSWSQLFSIVFFAIAVVLLLKKSSEKSQKTAAA